MSPALRAPVPRELLDRPNDGLVGAQGGLVDDGHWQNVQAPPQCSSASLTRKVSVTGSFGGVKAEKMKLVG
jgi:hypothetical protein